MCVCVCVCVCLCVCIGTSHASPGREGDRRENTFYTERKSDDPYKEQAAKGQLLTISDSYKAHK